MEPNKSQFQLLISFCFSLIILFFNPADAICVPRKASHNYIVPISVSNTAPVPAPVPSPNESSSQTNSFSAVPTPSVADSVKEIGQGVAATASFLAPKAAATVTDNAGLKNICSKTDYADLCLSSITPFFNGKTDLISALEMAIKAATEETKVALAAATKMAAEPGTPPSTVSRLNDCKDSYNDALDNFQSALDAIPARDTGTINSMLSAVVTDYSTCDDGFVEFNQKSLMATYNDKLGKMGSNCLAISSSIN